MISVALARAIPQLDGSNNKYNVKEINSPYQASSKMPSRRFASR